MKLLALSLYLALCASLGAAQAATVILAWDASPSPEVVGYKLHYGLTSGAYTDIFDVGNALTASVPNLTGGQTYYFAATAYSPTASSGFSNEVAQLMPGAAPQGLVLAWGFNEGVLNTVGDSSGNGHTGTLSPAAGWGVGRGNTSAIVLDGNASRDGYISAPAAISLGLGSTGTTMAWVLLNELSRWQGIISKGLGNNESTQNFAIEITDGDLLQCVIGTGSANNNVFAAFAPQPGAWFHAACTWDGSILRAYVDGAQVAQVAQTLTPVPNTGPLEVGRFGGGFDYLNGRVEDVRIYSRALTAAEIQADMDTPIGAATAPPSTVIGAITWFAPPN